MKPAASTSVSAAVLAVLGALVAALGFLALGALTGLGKAEQLVLPLTPVAALVGAVVALTPLRRLLWVACAATILACAIVALTPVTTRLLPPLVRRDPLPARPLDAVVVLSTGISPDSMLTSDGLDQLLAGLALMRDSVAPALVITRPRRTDNGATTAPDQARVRALVARSFPMLVVDSVHTTHDEATGAWRLLGARAGTAIALVTSPPHTRRACATFETVGFRVTCVPAPTRVYVVDRRISAWSRLALFRAWLYERAAWMEYRARGWVRA